jgi:Holliday junction resolvase - archaeal type
MNSKQNGNRGEREFAELCRAHGFDAFRNPQYGYGGVDNPDVQGLEGVHIECKRTEKLNIHAAMQQAKLDAAGVRMPIVAHRVVCILQRERS